MTAITDHMLKLVIEAALLTAQAPMDEKALMKLLPEENRPSIGELRQALAALAIDYEDRGVVLQEVASGFRFQVSEQVAPYLMTLVEEKPQRYSRAFLETLVLIAYRQPVTRAEIEDIRGVVVSSQIVRTLMELNWVKVVGHKDVPGRPALLATTKHFLDHFNLKSLEDLPALAEIKEIADIEKALEPEGDKESNETLSEAGDQPATEGNELPEVDQKVPAVSDEMSEIAEELPALTDESVEQTVEQLAEEVIHELTEQSAEEAVADQVSDIEQDIIDSIADEVTGIVEEINDDGAVEAIEQNLPTAEQHDQDETESVADTNKEVLDEQTNDNLIV